VIFIGTSDLAFSMGLRGDQKSAELQAAVQKVVAAAHRNGKVAGRPAFNTAMIPRLLDEGFRFLQAPSEVKMMSEGAQPYLELTGKIPGKQKQGTY